MKKNKILSILLIALSVTSIGINVYAHSGRTDSSGGHKDNKNKSGLGSYHYHCAGYSAHLHTNGVCPYSSSSTSSKRSTSSSSASSNMVTSKPKTVIATGITINEKSKSIKVGESKILTATITPNNTTDKNITWKSSDESVATISSSGKIIAKKLGTVDITAATANNKTSIIKISIKEEPKVENITIIKTSTNSKNSTSNNTTATKDNETYSIELVGVIILGLVGGGVYWVCKKYKTFK